MSEIQKLRQEIETLWIQIDNYKRSFADAQEKLAIAREALEFYATERKWSDYDICKRAREALAKLGEKG
jgi:hypothetical protein